MRVSLHSWCGAHPLAAYLLLIFARAWLVWLPVGAKSGGPRRAGKPHFLAQPRARDLAGHLTRPAEAI